MRGPAAEERLLNARIRVNVEVNDPLVDALVLYEIQRQARIVMPTVELAIYSAPVIVEITHVRRGFVFTNVIRSLKKLSKVMCIKMSSSVSTIFKAA